MSARLGRVSAPWWRPGAYVFLATNREGDAALLLHDNVALQRRVGAAVETLDGAETRAR